MEMIKERDVVVLKLNNGSAIIGRAISALDTPVDHYGLKDPRIVKVMQNPNNPKQVDISMIPFIGMPDEIAIPVKEVFTRYQVKDKNLGDLYVKVTTNLTIMSNTGFTNKLN